MRCPKCKSANRNGVKFCEECGEKFEIICPVCSAKIPMGKKFCGECGNNLVDFEKKPSKELSFEEKIDKIQRYLPKGVTEKILAQKGRIEGETKHITVLFCDLVGFTPMVEKLGHEAAYHMMDKVYEILIHKVHNYGGTVNEMTGDGVMALFGAPIALEDAPQRAIRSGMAIHRAITLFNNEMKATIEGLPPLKMRIGINTGHVVVGTLGNDLRVEFKAVGETVNLASRMEGLAEPGTTYVTEETFKLAEGFFRFEALGVKSVKGKKDPINVYRVISSSNQRTRFDVNAERGLTPFIGRQRELELLIDGFERSKKGYGQAFSIVSEAGAGKSRLLYEFRKAVANEEVIFLESKCLSFSKNVSYHPIVELLKASFNLMENDDDFEKIKKTKKGLNDLSIDEKASLKFLLELLSIKDSGFDKTSMSAEAKKERTLETLRQIPLKLSAIKSLVLVFEDLHWIDKTSEEYLKILLKSLPGTSIFLILSYRPEYTPTWSNRSYHGQINLNRLSNRESIEICFHLLRTKNINKGLEDLILNKTEGIPFFIEEFVKCLIELNAIEKKGDHCHLIDQRKNMEIPSTIQDVIATRVDSLDEPSKAILQVGSVIEREFSYSLIEKVVNLSEHVFLTSISKLKDAELIFERGIFPKTTYVFKHALTRDVVYNSILNKRKKQLHENVGNAFELAYSDKLDTYYGIMAKHFFISDNYIKAAYYSRLACKNAERAVSFDDAITFCDNWVQSIENQNPSIDNEKQLIDARTTLGFYYLQLQHFIKAKKSILPIIDIATKHNYKKRLTQIYALLGIHSLFIEEDFSAATEYLTKAIKLAEETNNFISLIFSNHYLGHVYIENCEFEKGYTHIKKALDIVEMGNVLWGIALHKACISLNVYCFQGKIKKAYRQCKEAVLLADKSDDVLSKTEAYTNFGICCLHKGFMDEAEKYLLDGREFSIRADLLLYKFLSNYYLSIFYIMNNNNKLAKNYAFDAVNLEDRGCLGESAINNARIIYHSVSDKVNMKQIDLAQLKISISQNKYKRYDGIIRNRLANILMDLDDEYFLEAEKWFENAIAMNRKHGLKFDLGFDYLSYGNYCKRSHKVSLAREMMKNALTIFEECGAEGWVEKVKMNLESIQLQQ